MGFTPGKFYSSRTNHLEFYAYDGNHFIGPDGKKHLPIRMRISELEEIEPFSYGIRASMESGKAINFALKIIEQRSRERIYETVEDQDSSLERTSRHIKPNLAALKKESR